MLRPDHIRKIVEDRDITHLLHMTFEENLPSILTHGLLPRDQLELRDDIMARISDFAREEGHEDAICLTVTRYQAPMFNRMKWDNPDTGWIFLVVDPDVLWLNDCLFCDRNASSNWIKRSPRNLATAFAFERMFEDFSVPKTVDGVWQNVSFREKERIPVSVPTDSQAEVMVKGDIAIDHIKQIWVETTEQSKRIQATIEKYARDGRPEVVVGEYSFSTCEGG